MSTAHTPAAHDSREPDRPRVYLIGEPPLVEQYAQIIAEKEYEVCVQWNNRRPADIELDRVRVQQTSVIPASTSVALELTNNDRAFKQKNLTKLDATLPATTPILSSSVTITAAEQSQWMRHRHRLVGFCAMPTLADRPLVEVAPTVFSPRETLTVVQHFFASIGKEIVLVQDRVGMVLPRILCQIINEAAFALQEDVATPQDVDIAMKLGTNYPLGPIEWGNKIGIRNVYHILQAMHDDLLEDRYRIAPLLKQLALTGEWWREELTISQ